MWTCRSLLRRRFVRSAGGERLQPPAVLSVSWSDDTDDQAHQRRFFATDDRDKSKRKGRNFDRDVLKPAAEGRLRKKHDSGVPKLAGRHRARLAPPPKRSGGRFTLKPGADTTNNELNWLDEAASEVTENLLSSESPTKTFSFDPTASERNRQPMDPNAARLGSFLGSDYFAPELLDDNRYYWNEEEFEVLDVEDTDDVELDDEGFFNIEFDESDSASQLATKGFKTLRSAKVDDEDDGDDEQDNFEDEGGEAERSNKGKESSSNDAASDACNVEEQYFFGQNDIFEYAAMDEKQIAKLEEPSDMVLPLRPHGPNLDDFLSAMVEHPTKYAQLVSERLHPDSKREPKPFFPKSRLHPPLSFVESHARFIFVSGLPPLEANGEPGDFDNPVHRDSLQKMLARLFGVDSDRVFPSSATSGFVGLSSPRELSQLLSTGPRESILYRPATISMFGGNDDSSEFASVSPLTTVEINGIPDGHTPRTLVRKLFPEGTEVGTVYGVPPDRVHFLSPTRALIRFDSAEQAESAVVSQVVGDQLKGLGEYPVRVFRARRELVHAGFDGPFRIKERRVMGPRLIVDGDMPTKRFFLSHARVLRLRQLDPAVGKEEIAAAFQPFSARPRDVDGSVEFVTCAGGRPTGGAYVGFDIPGEAEAAARALSGRVVLGDRAATLRLVKDRRVPGVPFLRPEQRPERSAAELLEDLNHWERYVDPADIEILQNAGVSRAALDEALRGIRYGNASFGAFDAAVRGERLQPEKPSGALYRELVEMYVATLKDCLAAPERVGALYEAVHFPEEPLDLSVFDRERQRQQALQERRGAPPPL